MDYANFNALSSSPKCVLDKDVKKEYNQRKKSVNKSVGSSAVTSNELPSSLTTEGTYIGSADVSAPTGNQMKTKNTTSPNDKKEVISDSDSSRMIDYLYAKENLEKNEKFLARNNYPTPDERDLNKQYYGDEEEKAHLTKRFKTQTNNALNPKLPYATDRAFLSGLWGDEKEQAEYDLKICTRMDRQK